MVDEKGTSSPRAENLAVIEILVAIFFFIFFYLATQEVSIEDSLSLCLTLLIDLLTGSLIWILISKKSSFSIYELVGVGIGLGTSLITIGQLCFRTLPIQPFMNLILFIAACSVFVMKFWKSRLWPTVSAPLHSSILGVLATALLLLCGDRYYLWLATGLLFIGQFWFTRDKSSRRLQAKFNTKASAVLLSIIAIALGASTLLESGIYGKRQAISYISGWDGAVFEASSKALITYGPFDHIFLANIKYSYYWFHDAWAGAITQRANASDWVVTTQFGALIVAVATTSLLFVIVDRRVINRRLVFAVLVVTATPSLIGAPSILISLASLSQVVAILWVTLILFFLDEYSRLKKISTLALITFTSCLLVLTKITTAVPLIVGLVATSFLCFFGPLKKHKNTQFAIATAFSIAVSTAIYFIFINPDEGLNQTYFEFSIGLTENLFGITSGLLLIDIVIFGLLKYFAVLQFFNRKKFTADFFTISALAISTSSLGFALLISFELSVANTYMSIPFLIYFSLIFGISVANQVSNSHTIHPQNKILFFTFMVIGLLSGAVSTYRLHELNFQYVTSIKSLVPASAVSLIILISAFLILLAFSKIKKISLPIALIVSVGFVAVPSGSFIVHSLREVQRNSIYERNEWVNVEKEDVVSEFLKLEPVVKSIRKNLTSADVLASNSTSDKALLAAMTGIRNFASSYVSDMQGVQERYPKQFDFAREPNFQTYQDLRSECVTWFYFVRDENNTPPASFDPFAQTVFEDKTGILFKLSEQISLPKRCLE